MAGAVILSEIQYEALDKFFQGLKNDEILKKTTFLTSIKAIGTPTTRSTLTAYNRDGHFGSFNERYPEQYENPLYKEAIAAEELYISYLTRDLLPEGFNTEQVLKYFNESRRRNAKIKAEMRVNPLNPAYLSQHGGKRNYKKYKKTYISKKKRTCSHKKTRTYRKSRQ